MKSSKISSNESKTTVKSSQSTSKHKTKKAQSIEGLNGKHGSKASGTGTRPKTLTPNSNNKVDDTNGGSNKFLTDHELAELALNDEFGTAFEKFWKSVTDGMDKQPHRDAMPRSTPIDNKISEIQKRIKMNQAILRKANERMKGITFAAERQNLSNWKEGLAFRNPSREDLNRFKDVKALDLEVQKLKESKSDRNVFLKSSPGIANFHETMENTLNMLDKIQKADPEFDEYDLNYRDIKSEFNLSFIKAPDMVAVSDEE